MPSELSWCHYTTNNARCQVDTALILWYNMVMGRLTLRLPDELHRQLVKEAARQERSLNAHIIYVLKTRRHHQPVINGGLPAELPPEGDTVKQEVGTDTG